MKWTLIVVIFLSGKASGPTSITIKEFPNAQRCAEAKTFLLSVSTQDYGGKIVAECV